MEVQNLLGGIDDPIVTDRTSLKSHYTLTITNECCYEGIVTAILVKEIRVVLFGTT